MAGTLIILITSLFMNAGSVRIVVGSRNMEQIVMNSIISCGTAGLFVFASEMIRQFQRLMNKSNTDQVVFDTQLLCGGVLAGLVSITASCHTISLEFACLTGLIGSMIYTFC